MAIWIMGVQYDNELNITDYNYNSRAYNPNINKVITLSILSATVTYITMIHWLY
jgi:hypothetical protein